MWLREMEYFDGYNKDSHKVIKKFSYALLKFEEKLHEVNSIFYKL